MSYKNTDNIPGIGPATRNKLLSNLKSFKRIKAASESEIKTILGEEKGKKIFEELKNH